MKALVAGIAAAILAACASSPPVASPDVRMRALTSHLATVDPPAGWTLTRVGVRGRGGFINAQLNDHARLVALSQAPAERRAYFAAPCPDRDSLAWSAFDRHGDIVIAVSIEGRRRFVVSCRP